MQTVGEKRLGSAGRHSATLAAGQQQQEQRQGPHQPGWLLGIDRHLELKNEVNCELFIKFFV